MPLVEGGSYLVGLGAFETERPLVESEAIELPIRPFGVVL
jgi:hypothetical protein